MCRLISKITNFFLKNLIKNSLKPTENIKNLAVNVIENELQAIQGLKKCIDDEFINCIEKIFNTKGRFIITGIGKSANIGMKIVSTLNSTGTPAVFMHAADAIHGDLGIVQKDDIVMCLSKSGNTPEIKVLAPLIKNSGNTLIAMVGTMDSFLARCADYRLNTTVEREACPNNLAPTSSTTAQLVMGDAIAMCLLQMRGFTAADFAKFHPGGALGKQLYLRVYDLILHNEKPKVSKNASIKEIILEISSKRLGVTAVVENDKILGVITDGDLRRMMQNHSNFDTFDAMKIMSSNPKTIIKEALAVDALTMMRNNNITQLLVVDEAGDYCGVVHLHDLLREGII